MSLFTIPNSEGIATNNAMSDFVSEFRDQVLEPVRHWLLELQFPSMTEYQSIWIQTLLDVQKASVSIGYLFYLTFRPLCICGMLLIRYLFQKSQQVAIQIWKFQSSLDLWTISMELAFLVTLTLVYFLKRYIHSKRYIPRIQLYLKKKQQVVIHNYMKLMDRIAQTSSLLAALLPHVLYVVLAVALQFTYYGRSLTRFLSVKLPTIPLLMIWLPSVQTILSIAQFKYWYNNVHIRQITTTSSSKSNTKISSTQPVPPESLQLQLQEWLMYWIVCSFFTALSTLLTYLPLISGLIFPSQEDDPNYYNSRMDTTSSHLDLQQTSIVSRIAATFSTLFFWWNQRGLLLKDVHFFLLLWAWIFSYLSYLVRQNNAQGETISKTTASGSTTFKKSVLPKKSAHVQSAWYILSPLHFLYQRIRSTFYSPLFFGSRPEESSHPIVTALYTNFDSFLQLAVLVKLIRVETKHVILRVISQGSHYIPSLVTLLMPSYFTSLGILYATYVVASGYSVKLVVVLPKMSKPKLKICTKEEDAIAIIHHLQYYVILFLLGQTLCRVFLERFILSAPLFRFLLFWIPFQKHVCLLFIFWLQVPLFDGANYIYDFLEQELVLFGFVKGDFTTAADAANGTNGELPRIARMVQRLFRLLPSASDNDSKSQVTDPDIAVPTNTNTAIQLEQKKEN